MSFCEYIYLLCLVLGGIDLITRCYWPGLYSCQINPDLSRWFTRNSFFSGGSLILCVKKGALFLRGCTVWSQVVFNTRGLTNRREGLRT